MDEKFVEILKKYSRRDDVEVTEDSDIFNDLALSSLGIYLAVNELEHIYDIKINMRALTKVKKAGELYKLLQSNNDDLKVW